MQKNMTVEMFMKQFANVKEKNDVFVCRVGVTWSCNKSKLIFRLWNITKGVCLSSINLVLPGTQRTTRGTGTDFIQSFKLIYIFANVWFKKRSTQLVKKRVSAVACENIHFSLLLATGDVSCRGTSVTQGQKFHPDDANQCPAVR